MRKVLIWLGVIVIAASLGVGAAAGFGKLVSAASFQGGVQRPVPYSQGQGTSPY